MLRACKHAASNKKRQKQPVVCHTTTTTTLLQLCHEHVEMKLADIGHASALNKDVEYSLKCSSPSKCLYRRSLHIVRKVSNGLALVYSVYHVGVYVT